MEEILEKRLTKYSAYKQSGEAWIGQIPKHWQTKKIKRIFEEKKHTSNSSLNCGSISFGEVVLKDDEKIPLSTKASYQELLTGEFLINPLNLNYDLISLRIALSKIDVVVSPGYIILKSTENINKDYFRHLLNQYDVSYMKLLGSGVRQTISFTHIANSLLLLPPIEEQTAIAQFLDQKTALIDKAIAIKEREIELLKERLSIVIHNAVTRGIDPNVKMKDSGIGWIGNIPEHWQIRKLKYLGLVKYGLGQPPKEKEGGLAIIRATNVERGKIVVKDMIYVDPDDVPWERDPMLKENDIIIVRSGAYTGDSAIVPKSYAGSIAGYDMVFTPTKVDAKFIGFALLSKYVLYDQLYLLRMRAAQPHLNAEELGQTIILCPPPKEQCRISQAIEVYSKKTEVAIFSKRKDIQKLTEYRSILIFSAVTGKIKVC
jgi:type I restriction enzyme S subunit